MSTSSSRSRASFPAGTRKPHTQYFSAEVTRIEHDEEPPTPPWSVRWENWRRPKKRLTHEGVHYLEIGRVVAILDPSGPEGETEYGLIFFAAPEGTELKASLPIGDTTWLDDINSRHMTLTLLIRADDDEVTKDFAIGMKIADGKGIARIRAVHD